MVTDTSIVIELSELAHISKDKAHSILGRFKSDCRNLNHMREFWNAKTAKSKAKIIKKHWL